MMSCYMYITSPQMKAPNATTIIVTLCTSTNVAIGPLDNIVAYCSILPYCWPGEWIHIHEIIALHEHCQSLEFTDLTYFGVHIHGFRWTMILWDWRTYFAGWISSHRWSSWRRCSQSNSCNNWYYCRRAPGMVHAYSCPFTWFID